MNRSRWKTRAGAVLVGANSLARLERIAIIAAITCASASIAAAQMSPAVPERHGWSARAVLDAVPEVARARKNPFEGSEREAAAGGKLFGEHCSDCHGAKAGGTRRGPSLLREEVQKATPGELFWALTNGVVWRGMPVWSKLPEPERWQIVTFIESLRPHETKQSTVGEAANR